MGDKDIKPRFKVAVVQKKNIAESGRLPGLSTKEHKGKKGGEAGCFEGD
jgi:hypothetical protein